MPPKAKITREMIVDAGLSIAREQGIENVNARTVSEYLGCSTQPVMYHFSRIEEMKRAVYAKADEYHSAFIMDVGEEAPLLAIGLNYIRFAQREKHLFRLLFQTNGFAGKSVAERTEAPELAPIFEAVSGAAGIDRTQAGTVFRSLFLLAHGYASMFANNALAYDERVIAKDLERAFNGALHTVKGETTCRNCI